MDRIFVDTDVVIDFLIDREPHSAHSSEIFDLAEKEEITLYIPSLCINNVHYVTRKVLGDKKAKDVIAMLVSFTDIQEVGKHDIWDALESNINDFEDAIQHSCAMRIRNLKAIVTRNTRDFKRSEIAVFTPETYLKTRGDN